MQFLPCSKWCTRVQQMPYTRAAHEARGHNMVCDLQNGAASYPTEMSSMSNTSVEPPGMPGCENLP